MLFDSARHGELSAPSNETPAEVLALRVPAFDWQLIVTARPNLLVEGPQESIECLVAALASVSPEPLWDWRQSPKGAAATTLLVQRIDALTVDEQRQLMDRMRGGEGQPVPRQVISTSATAVFPLVEKGLFREDLYYRLNSMRLEIGATA